MKWYSLHIPYDTLVQLGDQEYLPAREEMICETLDDLAKMVSRHARLFQQVVSVVLPEFLVFFN
jgi:hypothetical protein